ncbi:MAG: hypothetical protein JWM53_6676 [bacterium]|nr:hypothetical protein [bacterium]
MTTTMTMTARFVAALALLATVAACGGGNNNNGSPDMAMTTGGGGDMAQQATCVMDPTTSVELLNGCTTAQTGDSAKDAPYFPSLAPNGSLPPLP